MSTRAMLIAASALGGATLLGITALGGTYALWKDSSPMSAGTITSGSLTLKVDGESALTLPSAGWHNMLPGDRITRQLTVSTAGAVSTTVTVASTSSSGSHQVRVRNGACPAVALTGAALGSTPVTLGTWTANQSSTVCLEVTLPASTPSAAQGTTTPIALSFRAEQIVN